MSEPMDVDWGEPAPAPKSRPSDRMFQRATKPERLSPEQAGAAIRQGNAQAALMGGGNGGHPAGLGRTLPHSIEAEEYLIGACLIDEGETLAKAEGAGIAPVSFYVTAHQIAFEGMLALRAAAQPVSAATLAEHLRDRQQLDACGGMAFIVQVSSQIPTTAQASFFIDKVREQSVLRNLIRAATGAVESAYNYSGGGIDEFLAEQAAKIQTANNGYAPLGLEATPITSFSYPDGDDPNVLLGSDDYLGRGGGMLFVSHAGAGKSSWILDACMSWAIARPWMGIRSNGPLKSLIVQAEDSDRYLGKLRSSFEHATKTTPQQSVQLGQNCVIVRLKGVSGAAFFAALRALVKKHAPDLVVINPIYLYAEGDIGRSEFAQPFLVGLDAVNKDEKFGYILVHHTGKPQAKGKDGTRSNVEDWESVYMGFGSSYLANWPRCSALLEPVTGYPGSFTIRLGKGGPNAGVTRQVEQGVGWRTEPVTKIPIRHSRAKMEVCGVDRPVYFWEPDEERPEAEQKRASTGGGGRPAKYEFEDYRNLFPAHNTPGMEIGQLEKLLGTNLPIPKPALHNALKRWTAEGVVETLSPLGHPKRYRLVV